MQVNTEDKATVSGYQEDARVRTQDNTHEIVSKMAYLIGVPREHFEAENEPFRWDLYKELDAAKNARLLRNLCVVRASVERWFAEISERIQKEYKSIYTVPEYIPQQALDQLSLDGIQFSQRAGTQLVTFIIEINHFVCDRVNNCKSLFPVWLKWEYVRDLFIMKNGLTEWGAKAAADIYYANIDHYPYGIYINMRPKQCVNILSSDKVFVTKLYQANKDRFTDLAKCRMPEIS